MFLAPSIPMAHADPVPWYPIGPVSVGFLLLWTRPEVTLPAPGMSSSTSWASSAAEAVACHAPLLEECPQYHGHLGDPEVTPETCGAIGEKAQVILVWMRAQDVGNASHPQRLGVTRVRPKVLDGSWCPNSRMLKNTSIGGMSKKL